MIPSGLPSPLPTHRQTHTAQGPLSPHPQYKYGFCVIRTEWFSSKRKKSFSQKQVLGDGCQTGLGP